MNTEIIDFISKIDKKAILKKIQEKRKIGYARYDYKMNASYCLGVVFKQGKINDIKNFELLKQYKKIKENLSKRQEAKTTISYNDYTNCQEFEKGINGVINDEIQQLIYDLLFTPDKIYLIQELNIKDENSFRSIIMQYTGYCYRNKIEINNSIAIKMLNNYKNNKINATSLKEFNNEKINKRRKY